MKRRSGVTLLEVLVAIFVMGIGLLALLTLFPLGALRMAKAIEQQRCAECAANAQAISVMVNIRNEAGLYRDAFNNPTDPFKNPKMTFGGINSLDASMDGPSYPVLIDTIGWRGCVNGSANQRLVGQNGSCVARTTVSFANTNQSAYQWFSLLDDIDFEGATTGGNSNPGTPRWLLPVPPAPQGSFIRDIRYSYAFLCQRPRYGDSTVVDMQIVVYNKRPVSMTGSLTLPEYVYTNSTFNIANNTVTVNYGAGVPPPVRAGDWILDATPLPNAANPTTAHGYFYRIVGANDLGGNLLELEVETPFRGFTANTVGTIIVLDGVAEVINKGPARLP